MASLCLYNGDVERTDLKVNFGIYKSVVMVSVVQVIPVIISEFIYINNHLDCALPWEEFESWFLVANPKHWTLKRRKQAAL